MVFKPISGKIECGSLPWLEMVHQHLADKEIARALKLVEVAIEKAKSSSHADKMKQYAELSSSCPDCLGSGFKPTSLERGAPHVKCDHKGTQPILQVQTRAVEDPDIPF